MLVLRKRDGLSVRSHRFSSFSNGQFCDDLILTRSYADKREMPTLICTRAAHSFSVVSCFGVGVKPDTRSDQRLTILFYGAFQLSTRLLRSTCNVPAPAPFSICRPSFITSSAPMRTDFTYQPSSNPFTLSVKLPSGTSGISKLPSFLTCAHPPGNSSSSDIRSTNRRSG